MAKRGHSSLGASKADRFLNCPGSALLEEKYPDVFNEYAFEGSVAHRLGEKCLLNGHEAAAYIGKDILMENGKAGKVTEEMAEAVQIYLDEVNRIAEKTGSKPEVEAKVHLYWIHKDLFGTCDCIVREPFGSLYVLDYKHGQGKVVDEETAQTKFYALGALGPAPKSGVEDFENVIVGIVQPRAGGSAIRYSEPMSVSELRKWGDEVLKPGAARAKRSGAPLKSGSWCKFCKASADCVELRKLAIETAGDVFETPVVENPDTMTVERLSEVLKVVPLLEDWLKQVEIRSHTLAMGGVQIPGYKLVIGKSGHRAWINPDEVGDELYMTLGEEVYDRKVKSPAQMEKLCKREKIDFGTLAPLITQPAGKPQLVRDSDPRPAITNLSAEDIFKGEE